MKTIKLYVLPLLFIFIIGNAFGQDEFYNDKTKKPKKSDEVELVKKGELVLEESYCTEADYKLKQKAEEKNQKQHTVDEDWEVLEEDHQCEDENCCKNGLFKEIAIEVAVEVFVNAAVILLTFWQ